MNKIAKIINFTVLIFFLALLMTIAAENKGGGRPPANVVSAQVAKGVVAQKAEFVGSVYYPQVSEVASETSGSIEKVQFEDGKRIKKGKLLVRLNADLLKKTIKASKAAYEQILLELEKSQLDFRRIENLYKTESIAKQVFDEHRFRVKIFEKKAFSLKADLERYKVELRKKTIKSPYSGIVIKKHVDLGEWLSSGSKVVTMANDTEVDVIVDIPENILQILKIGSEVPIKAGGKTLKGKIHTIVPRGEVSTRTFPVKIRLKNENNLIEGMEASVQLPVGKKRETLLVPRDAIIQKFGKNVVFVIKNGAALMIPVNIIGYKEMLAGVKGEGLLEGARVVVKGNERLNPGQPVMEPQKNNQGDRIQDAEASQ